jgi:hypothetical protein
MHKEKLARTSVFLGQEQLDQLREMSAASGIPVAVMIRRGIGLYLDSVSGGQGQATRAHQAGLRYAQVARAPGPEAPVDRDGCAGGRDDTTFHRRLSGLA